MQRDESNNSKKGSGSDERNNEAPARAPQEPLGVHGSPRNEDARELSSAGSTREYMQGWETVKRQLLGVHSSPRNEDARELSSAGSTRENMQGWETVQRQLSSIKIDTESIKHSMEKEMQSLRSQLITMESENELLKSSMEKEKQTFQTQLSFVESDNEMISKEMQLLRDQLSQAKDANDSLVKSKQELGAEYCGATESAESKSRLLVSILDNYNFEGAKSEEVLSEMEKLFGMMERYTGSITEMVSMPQMPGMTIIGKAAELAEPNLAAARRLWISSRCGSLALDVAQAFFMQREIPLAQFALLPWIYASLNRAVTTMCEKSTLTPDLAITSVWILQGLVYTATVAREWSEGVWKIEEMLAQMTHWLGEHVSREASLLMKIVDQFNESQSTSISPNDVEESQRIDSGNSEIPDGMALVVDASGILILFTADNAFIFGANEVKVLESSSDKTLVMKFDQAVTGLPATLMELQLGLNAPAEVTNRHEALLKSVLTQDRIKFIYTSKRRRMR